MKHRTNDDPAKARTAGADDIDMIDDICYPLKALGQKYYDVAAQSITNLLETERERVLDMVEAGLPEVYVTEKMKGDYHHSFPPKEDWAEGYNSYRTHTLKVIERLRGGS